MRFLLPLLWLACAPPPAPDTPPWSPHGDGDGDGFTADVDCDDANPLVHPAAQERCNGVDDDCSAATLEASSMSMIPSSGAAEVLLCSALMIGNLHLVDAQLLLRSEIGTVLRAADDSRPVVHVQGGRLKLQDVTLSGPDGTSFPGSPLLRVHGAEVHLRSVLLHRGQSDRGGAILALGGAHVVLESSRLVGNSTIGEGGAVALEDATLDITASFFEGNFARDRGGAIDAVRSTVTMVDTHLEDNDSDGYGGAVSLVNGRLTASRSKFGINHASRGGGGLHALDSRVHAVDSAFVNNGSSLRGGGLHLIDAVATFEAVELTLNYAGPDALGGALFAARSTVEASWVRVHQNHALPWGSGGAIHLEQDSVLRAESSTFGENVAGARGGAVNLLGSTFEADAGSIVLANSASEGGGFAMLGGRVEVGSIRGNAARRGGGLWIGRGSPPAAVRADVADNVAAEQGGGVYATGAAVRFDGSLRGNVSIEGGGAWIEGAATLGGLIDWADADHDNTPDDLASYLATWSSEASGEWSCHALGCDEVP